jgi:hypothetical protein
MILHPKFGHDPTASYPLNSNRSDENLSPCSCHPTSPPKALHPKRFSFCAGEETYPWMSGSGYTLSTDTSTGVKYYVSPCTTGSLYIPFAGIIPCLISLYPARSPCCSDYPLECSHCTTEHSCLLELTHSSFSDRYSNLTANV